MNYESASVNPTTKSSILQDGQCVNGRLAEILGRISKIGDAMHGSEPRDAGGGPSPPEPAASARRNIDAAAGLLNRIESELNRIESRL